MKSVGARAAPRVHGWTSNSQSQSSQGVGLRFLQLSLLIPNDVCLPWTCEDRRGKPAKATPGCSRHCSSPSELQQEVSLFGGSPVCAVDRQLMHIGFGEVLNTFSASLSAKDAHLQVSFHLQAGI